MKFSGVFFVIDLLSSPFFSPGHLGSPEASKRVPAGVAAGVWGESSVGRATVGVDQATLGCLQKDWRTAGLNSLPAYFPLFSL